ncbi:MAG: acyltransferase [Sphingomonas sp.]|uniref:acyltransferase family protein n=1 Tax=Sphingomonas sp. TaxID=28214 RepID=UPI0012119414|nr:acyltransferase [Sphingomonas sp.]THD35557.1 MAG: acyltransferase [Sphingomonas sp.]
MERHYGMDWLRIGAFAVLILYHTAMVFTPWGFHVKTAQPVEWLSVAMLISNPWRLTLLFVVSGYASRALFAKSGGVGRFLTSRASRLLVPLAFGVALIVPPQSWVELVTQHEYDRGFGYFLVHDYFAFAANDGVGLPTWNHLWFVGYLFAYTAVLGLLLLVPRPVRLQEWFDRAFGGWRALVLPVAYLVLSQVIVFHRWSDSQDLIHDGVAHLAYFPAFLFGFGLARSAPVMAAFVRWWKPAALLAVASYAFGAAIEVNYAGDHVPDALSDPMLIAHQIQCWAAVAALIGVAERHLNRDAAIRPMLTEAVFPFYLIHQTVIVLGEYALQPFGLGAAAEFAILVPVTVAGCWAFYLFGREVNWLRPLIGLRRRVARATARRHDNILQSLVAGDPWWRRRDRAQPDPA